MKRTLLAIAFAFATTFAFAAEAVKLPDPVTITLSRQALQIVGQGLGELPLKTAAPILNDLQNQLNAADKAAQDAADKKPEGAAHSTPGAAPPRK